MLNPVSEDLMFANMKAREAQIRRSFGQPTPRTEARRWWRASQQRRAARRTR